MLIENGSFEKAYNGQYRSKMHPNALIANLTAWMARYNAHIIFCRAETFPKLCREILYREAKEILTNMEADTWKADWIDGKITSIHKLGVDFFKSSLYNIYVDEMFGGVLSALT